MDLCAIIMAAGHGKRMKSDLPKVLHRVCGQPMLQRIVSVAHRATGEMPVCVVGVGREKVMEEIGATVRYALQEEQHGTGHAVMMARPYLEGKSGYVIVLAGDMPLLTVEILQEMIRRCQDQSLDAVVLTSEQPDPTGYGRILRDSAHNVQCIVEEKDATSEQKLISEVNASVYCFSIEKLLSALDHLTNDNAQCEYYLTDCIGMLSASGRVGAYVASTEECMGVNDKVQLARVETLLRKRINEEYMRNGVIFLDPDAAYIEESVLIEEDVIIHPGVHIRGTSIIGAHTILEPGCVIENTVIGVGCHIRNSTLVEAEVGDRVTMGPYAHIRPGSHIGADAHIGDFVEIKGSSIGKGTKVAHLTYIGDARVGDYCNIACGVVFANYDGLQKYQTVVGNGVFLGCNVNLIAPVTVADGAYIAAGTTVDKDVPKGALSVGRARQCIKDGWADEKRAKAELRDVY